MPTIRNCPICGADYTGPACPTCRGPRTEAAPAGPPPADLPGLEILGLLGRGGMGAVYKARQTALDREVAVKILPMEKALEPERLERFEREAKALASLNHPNIVGVYDFGRKPLDPAQGKGALCFFIMELVEGRSLRELLREERPSVEESRRIVAQVCDALDYAHKRGVIHRDIKPENILLDGEGRVKIADYGLAKFAGPQALSPALTQSGESLGTLNYMAPEQMKEGGAVDHRADLYSTGVVLYELLTGEIPVGKFDPPSRYGEVGAALDGAVLRALEKDPSKRPQGAAELRALLVAPKRTRAAVFGIGAVLLSAGIAVSAVFFLRRGTEPAPKEKPGAIDLTVLRWDPKDLPGRELPHRFPTLPQNPYFAPSHDRTGPIRAYLRALTGTVFPVEEGSVAVWGSYGFVAVRSAKAMEIRVAMVGVEKFAETWHYGREDTLVFAFLIYANARREFLALVDRLQMRLRLPLIPPPLTLRSLVIAKKNFGSAGYAPAERLGSLALPIGPERLPDAVAKEFPVVAEALGPGRPVVYLSGIEDKKRGSVSAYLAVQWQTPQEAADAATRLKRAKGGRPFAFLARERILLVLFPAPGDAKGFRILATTLQLRSGGRVEEIPIPE